VRWKGQRGWSCGWWTQTGEEHHQHHRWRKKKQQQQQKTQKTKQQKQQKRDDRGCCPMCYEDCAAGRVGQEDCAAERWDLRRPESV